MNFREDFLHKGTPEGPVCCLTCELQLAIGRAERQVVIYCNCCWHSPNVDLSAKHAKTLVICLSL